MALVKSVEIDIGVKGDADSRAKLDAISARAEELKKAFPEYTLKIDSMAASEKLRVFRAEMADTAARVSKPMDPVVLTDKARAKLEEIRLAADDLKARFPEFTIRIDDTAAKRKLAVFAAEAKATTDIVDAELASAGGGRGGLLGRIGGLFGGGGGGGAGGAASGGGGLLSSPVGIGAIAGGGLLAAGVVPGLVGLGIGGLVGAGAVGGGVLGAAEGNKVLKADTSNIKQITTALKTAIGQQKQQLSAALVDANKQYAKDSAFYAPFIAFQKSLTDLAQNVLKPLQPIMEPLSKIIAGFGKGLTALGPQMTTMFKASLPFIQQFATVMLQAGKILMPAFTQAMNTMVRSGALKEMTQGLVYLIQGLAGFVVALGPGMKASGQIFERLCLVLKGAMIGLGVIVSTVARVLEFNWPKAVDNMRHKTAATFDGLRHDVSSIWDTMWNNTLGRLQRAVADDQKLMNQLRHDIANTFDGIRHDIASAWDTIWNNTVGRVKAGISDVTGWFRGLPGRVISALFGFGHSLYAFAHAAMTEFWDALKNVGATTWNWLTGWVKALPGWLRKLLGISSPSSVFYDIGKNMMLGLFHGIKDHAWKASNLAKQTAAGLGGGFPGGGASGPGAASAQRYASSILHLYGWGQSQMSSLIPLWNQESGWNYRALNASSGAYGIPQSLPADKMAAAGPDWRTNPATQIRWGLGYIRDRYGSPAAAEAHERAFNWYDQGGWLMPGLTLAMNATGRPEQVIPPGGSSGQESLLADIAGALDEVIGLLRAAPNHTGRALGDALNGVARSSAYSSMYGSR